MARCSQVDMRCCHAAPIGTQVWEQRALPLYKRRGGAHAFVQSYDRQSPEEGKCMGAKTTSILHRERDQDVRTYMYRSDGLHGVAISLELSVFSLF